MACDALREKTIYLAAGTERPSDAAKKVQRSAAEGGKASGNWKGMARTKKLMLN